MIQDGPKCSLSQAQVLKVGRAQTALHEHHIKRTRYAYQVSLTSLCILKQKAYSEYYANVLGPPESLQMWDERCQAQISMFKYWSIIMELALV